MNTARVDYLTGILKDADAEFGDRDDAAIALASHNEQEALEALLITGSDPSTDPELADTCGESIAEIWSRQGAVDQTTLQRLTGVARIVALRTLKALSPDLAEVLSRSGVEIP